MFVEDYKRKYKTEMCKNWELKGQCKFGDKVSQQVSLKKKKTV